VIPQLQVLEDTCKVNSDSLMNAFCNNNDIIRVDGPYKLNQSCGAI
jgi:hypothetical protein